MPQISQKEQTSIFLYLVLSLCRRSLVKKTAEPENYFPNKQIIFHSLYDEEYPKLFFSVYTDKNILDDSY